MSEASLDPGQTDRSAQIRRATRLFLWVGAAGLASFVVWATVGRLEVASMATGEVVPASQVKAVAHLEGGIVREILVREGDTVAKDQPLIELESIQSGADVGELGLRIVALRADVARLEAESSGRTALALPPELEKEHPELAAQAHAQFASRRQSLSTNLSTQEETIAQRQQAIGEIEARLRNNRNALKLMEEQIGISSELLKDQLTNRLNHLVLLREAQGLKSRIEEDMAAQRRTEAALKEAQSQSTGIRNAYQQDVNDQLGRSHRELDEMSERVKKFTDSLHRTVLRSPVDGLVKTMYVATRGGVVQAGKTVVDIVPLGDRLVVEAKLPVHDIGYVQAGQKAFVRLASQDGARFGHLTGTVVNISPDSIVTDKGAYYKVRLETEGDRFRAGREEYRLYPGTQVTAAIVTGDRTVMEYILQPFMGHMSEALRER